VGKGLSVVTLGYLRRFLVFCRQLFEGTAGQDMPVNQDVAGFYSRVVEILDRFEPILRVGFDDGQRKAMLDALGQAGSDFREGFYQHGLSGEMVVLRKGQISQFLSKTQAYVDESLSANRRPDDLYHAYNTLQVTPDGAVVKHMYEMLEGQVSILSSGLLSAQEALALLNSLRTGRLYRADQHSYILYPDRDLPGFLQKNCIAPEQVSALDLARALDAAQDKRLLYADVDGVYHFAGRIRNVKDVNQTLAELEADPAYSALVESEADAIRALFERHFNHQQFTGRSGTFFAYEGLGSIYWHMVSKLLLAVQEAALKARNEPDGVALSQALLEKYRDIRSGLGFNKSPQVYGAFPTDPYSHTPKGQGAKQPGMTGQVKEEILTRQAEVGLRIQDGRLIFDPFLLDPQELLKAPADFNWIDMDGQTHSLQLEADSLAFTFCQVPIIVQCAGEDFIQVHKMDGKVESIQGNLLDTANSQHIFKRDGVIHHVLITTSVIPILGGTV